MCLGDDVPLRQGEGPDEICKTFVSVLVVSEVGAEEHDVAV